MIKSGKAYTDNTAQLQMREERMNGIASAHRDDSIESNLEHFAQMQAGSEEGLKWCLRAKISVDDPNKAMRDPVIYRCNLEPHHRTGSTWKIYPGYDFACPIVVSRQHCVRASLFYSRGFQTDRTAWKASPTLYVQTSTEIETRNIGGCLMLSTCAKSISGISVASTSPTLC